MLENFIKEATNLANKPELTVTEHRRFTFLLTTIVQLRSGKSMDAINDNYRNEQLVRLGALSANVSARKSEERSRLLESLKEIGIKRGYREKVLKALRPELA